MKYIHEAECTARLLIPASFFLVRPGTVLESMQGQIQTVPAVGNLFLFHGLNQSTHSFISLFHPQGSEQGADSAVGGGLCVFYNCGK